MKMLFVLTKTNQVYT